jgi:hypothetical protein
LKKRILYSVLIAIVLLFTIGGVVFADDPTTVDVSWDGAGLVSGSVNTGDASAVFQSNGATGNLGAFSATDSNNNPYSYGVDNGLFSLDTNLSGAGIAELTVSRLTSKESMYGAAGQISYTGVSFTGGSATLQNRSSTNYAGMVDGNYGWNANDHVTVLGATTYALIRSMNSGTGNFAGIQASGAGDADLDCMSSEAKASQVRLGWGAGCYTNADFNANGSGTMTLQAWGNNSATTAALPGMTGANSFSVIASWVGGFNVADYSTTAN